MIGGMRLGAVIVALAAVVALPVVASTESVEAAWSDPEYATASATAATVGAPTKGAQCVVGGLSTTVTYAWAHGAGTATRSGYVFGIYRNNVLVGSETTLPATDTSHIVSSILAGYLANTQYEFRLQAVAGTWRSTAISGTFTTNAGGGMASCTWNP
ncbi:hypothetical protein [Agrococcus jejuensis]|uniref:Fibronectin type-III domain-containing protein n=1 Tax=Agrococcus jejuensis TaxID=399736 RepID=A0A1G8B2I3_9MICO|nr:hypothetical protein [Agrococcus jejuensis]SDH27472.1 hypothetical protein SAMN04489720_0635 [Agrococcus jejuensis]